MGAFMCDGRRLYIRHKNILHFLAFLALRTHRGENDVEVVDTLITPIFLVQVHKSRHRCLGHDFRCGYTFQQF
jgi:hypothetical protein